MYVYAQNLEENYVLKKMIHMVKLKEIKSTIHLDFWFGWIEYCFVGETADTLGLNGRIR